MRIALAGMLAMLPGAGTGAVEPPRLICFGNEPSWSVEIAAPDVVWLALPDEERREFRGGEMHLEPLRERIWRGKPATGEGDLVLFLAETACSDGMSDTSHPISARLSLADGRFFAGCCRSSPAALEGTSWRLTRLSTLDFAALAAAGAKSPTARFEAGRVSGFAGCNQYGGTYALSGDRLTLGPLIMTKMACAEPAMTVENAFAKAFAGELGYGVGDGRLTLASEAGVTMDFAEGRP